MNPSLICPAMAGALPPMKLAMLGADYMLAGMGAETERRKPERRRVAVLLLRRIAIAAIAASLLLWLGPRVLTELGLLGPSVEEHIAAADRTLRAAESYGATRATPSFVEAAATLQQ